MRFVSIFFSVLSIIWKSVYVYEFEVWQIGIIFLLYSAGLNEYWAGLNEL